MVSGWAGAGTIGFVNAERAVVEVGEGKAKLRELDAWATPRRKQLEDAASRVAELRERIDNQTGVATEESLKRLRQEELEARRQFEDAKRAFERELTKKQDEFLSDVALKMGTVASEYGERNGYDAIFVYEAQPLIYVSDEADLTETVIRLYNERFPVGD
jgi:outer membrane protein